MSNASDYKSLDEAKGAIDRYFEERNIAGQWIGDNLSVSAVQWAE
jgi:hypothetical protein